MNAPANGRPLDGQLAFFDTPAAQRGRYVPTYAGDFSATHARLGEDGLNVSVYLDLLGVGEFVPRSVEHLQGSGLGSPDWVVLQSFVVNCHASQKLKAPSVSKSQLRLLLESARVADV